MKQLGLVLAVALSALLCVHAVEFKLGVSFSGGGARAAIGTLAAYDSLVPHLNGIAAGTHQSAIGSVSGTSGGTWGIALHAEGRVTEKTHKKSAFEMLKAWTAKAKEWGPEGGPSDANTPRFNEDWKERVCIAVYVPFAGKINDFCEKHYSKSGQEKKIVEEIVSEGNGVYLGINAYMLSKHKETGNNAAQLTGADSQKPDYFLRYSPRSQNFYVCDEVDCSNPKIAEVFLAQTKTRLEAQKAKLEKARKEQLAKQILDAQKGGQQQKMDNGKQHAAYNMNEYLPMKSLLEVLSFASSAYSSNKIPGLLRATSIKAAIQLEGSKELIPVILADAGIFQNNPFGLLGERIIVSFDFSDITSEAKWETGYVTSSLKAKNVKTEAIAMPKPQQPAAAAGAVAAAAAAQVKSQAVDPDVAFLIHRIADPPKTFIQVPARFLDNALAYRGFPTMTGVGGTSATRYSVEKMDQYYGGLSKFYAAIKDKLRETIAAEMTAIVQQQANANAAQQPAAAAAAAAAPPALF